MRTRRRLSRRRLADRGDACLREPADADGLRAVADGHGARLLFDAAHGYGASRDGVKVGGLGDAEIFSLSGTKPVTTAEGVDRDERSWILERIELLRGYGFFGDYNSKLVGLNGKMSELHAALGLLTMRRVDEALAVRESHIAAYRAVLDTVPGIAYQRVRPQDRSTYKDFALIFTDRACRDKVETRSPLKRSRRSGTSSRATPWMRSRP